MRDRLAWLVERVLAAGERRGGLDPAAAARWDAVAAALAADHAPAAADEDGSDDQLAGLGDVFGLDPTDLDLLAVVGGSDVDANVGLAYGLLRGLTTPARPTVALALELVGVPTLAGDGLARLGPTSALRRSGLLDVDDDRPWLNRELALPDRVLAHLLGVDDLDRRLTGLVVTPVLARVAEAETVARAVLAGAPLVWVHAPMGTAGLTLAAGALDGAGLGCLAVDVLRCADDADVVPVLRAAVREAALRGLGLVVVNAQRIADVSPAAFGIVEDAVVPVVAIGDTHWRPAWLPQHPLVVTAPVLTPAARSALWRETLSAEVADELAGLRLSPEAIDAAGRYARRLAAAADEKPTLATAQRAARLIGGSATSSGATRPGVRQASFDDLVLPGYVESSLRRLVAWARHRDAVLADGRLVDVGEKGTGLAALFGGSPGTGKTLAAHVIASELGLDLFRVDLSSIVDKYIGETEKNLEKVFHEAESLNVVLFFDEADALFGKRSDVKDAHDRYANQEVAYLLQRMEHFDGITVLATNLRGNLDPAFSRRMSFIVHFPDPDATTRQRLWEAHLARVDTDPADPVDAVHLAGQVELAGGDVRNIVLAATYDAVAAGELVGLRHVLAATVREYHKLGRRVPADGFRPPGTTPDTGSAL